MLDEISDYRGKTPPYVDKGIPVISAENVGGGRVKSTTKWVTQDVYKKWLTRGIPEAGDTILTMEAPAGEMAEFPNDGPYLLTRRVIAMRPNRQVILKRYLYWFMYWLSISGHWARYVHGTTVPRLYKPDVLKTQISVPPKDFQSDISEQLNKIWKSIEHANTRTEKLNGIRRFLLQQLLER